MTVAWVPPGPIAGPIVTPRYTSTAYVPGPLGWYTSYPKAKTASGKLVAEAGAIFANGFANVYLTKEERAVSGGFPWDNWSWEMTTRLTGTDTHKPFGVSFGVQGRTVILLTEKIRPDGDWIYNLVLGETRVTWPEFADVELAISYDANDAIKVYYWEHGTSRPSTPTVSLSVDWYTHPVTSKTNDYLGSTDKSFSIGVASSDGTDAFIHPLVFAPLSGGTASYYQPDPSTGISWPVYELTGSVTFENWEPDTTLSGTDYDVPFKAVSTG